MSLALALGCGGGAGDVSDAQAIAVAVTPDTTVVVPQQSQTFAAVVTGTANTAVTWSIQEGPSGGTISASGIYTAPATTGVFTIVATSQAAPVSGSATVTVTPPPPVDGTSPMLTAHRTSGVAPLAVFFDAVDTNTPSDPASPFVWTSGVYQPADYEGTLYSWDFGDPGAGTWTQTGNARNTATGYTAAHVYENPGTYVATLKVTDLQGTVRTYTQSITVNAFSGTTFYVAANGSDTANGTSQTTPLQTVDRAMAVALATAGPVRVLFRRGDTFNTAGQWNITKPGPGIVGAYGTGNRPVLNCSFDNGSGYNIFQPSSPGRDWRFMDLDMRSTNPATTSGPIGPPVDHQGVDILLLRLASRDWNDGIGWGNWTPIYATPHDGIFIVETESTSPNGTYVGYIGGRRLAFLGNNFHDCGRSHVLRVWQAHKAVISNSTLARPGGQRHALKLHGPLYRGPEPETRWVSITDNVFAASGTSQWTVSMGSQSDVAAEAAGLSHVLYERNRHTASPSTIVGLEGSASATMIRDNVFDSTLCGDCSGIYYHRRGTTEPVPTGLRILNNTFYKGSASSGSAGVDVGGEVVSGQVRNNLFGASSAANLSFVVGGGGTGWTADHNLLTASPGFTNAASGDFTLAPGSSAISAGVVLPEVREDFRRLPRGGAAYDLGAFEAP